MYNATSQQLESETKLLKQGYKFSNWIAAQPDANNKPMTDHGTMVMIKRSKFRREYREIEPDGNIN